jgi:hypothetical protein
MIALPIVDTKKTEFRVADAPTARLTMAVRPDELAGAAFSLRQIHARISDLPAETAVLGLGEDGLPLLFDLRDPRPGPILVLGDKFSGKTRLLQTIVQSLILRNRAAQVQFAVLSGKPEQWQALQQARRDYFRCLYSNYERAAAATILELCDLVEARQNGEPIDRSILFLLDGMDTVPYMDFGIRMNFEWLLKEGPAARVWPLAALDSESAMQQLHWVNRFRTRLIGAIARPDYGRDLVLSNDINPADLLPGSQFAVRLNRNWLVFNLPALIP